MCNNNSNYYLLVQITNFITAIRRPSDKIIFRINLCFNRSANGCVLTSKYLIWFYYWRDQVCVMRHILPIKYWNVKYFWSRERFKSILYVSVYYNIRYRSNLWDGEEYEMCKGLLDLTFLTPSKRYDIKLKIILNTGFCNRMYIYL